MSHLIMEMKGMTIIRRSKVDKPPHDFKVAEPQRPQPPQPPQPPQAGLSAAELTLVLLGLLAALVGLACLVKRGFPRWKAHRSRRSQERPVLNNLTAINVEPDNIELPARVLSPPPYSVHDAGQHLTSTSNITGKNFNKLSTEEPTPPYRPRSDPFLNNNIYSAHGRQTDGQTSSDEDNVHNDLIEHHHLMEAENCNEKLRTIIHQY